MGHFYQRERFLCHKRQQSCIIKQSLFLAYFYSAHFSRKCTRLLQWVVFFRRVRSTFLFICSTTSNLNNLKPQHPTTPTSEARPKRKEKTKQTSKDPTLAPLFFGTMRLFLKSFGLHQRAPLHLFRYFATQWMSKNRKGSPLLHFSAL